MSMRIAIWGLERQAVQHLAVLLATLAAAIAQAPVVGRVPHGGHVVDAAGKPVAGAQVVCLGVQGHGVLGAEDLVRVACDGGGRYEAKLWPGRPYLVWATCSTAAGDLVTEAVPCRPGGTDLTFVAGQPPAPARWSLAGTARWRQFGALRVQWLLAGSTALLPLAELDDDGSMPLPPLPALAGELRVYVGERLVEVDSAALSEPARLAPPQRAVVEVSDAKGAPLAGATVARLGTVYGKGAHWFPEPIHGERHFVGTTDAAGRVEVLVAAQLPLQRINYVPPLVFVASKPGHGDALSGRLSHDGFDNLKLVAAARGEPGVLRVRCQLGETTTKPGMLRAGASPLPAQVRFVARRFVEFDANSSYRIDDCWTVPVAADGTFARPTAAPSLALQAVEIPGVQPELPASDPFAGAAVARHLVVPAAQFDTKQELDLRTVRALRVVVRDGLGPVVGAHVLVAPKSGAQFVEPALAMVAETVVAGRAVLPVVPGTWLVAAVRDGAWASAVVDVGKDVAVQTLTLQGGATVPVRVLGRDGEPVAGAHFLVESVMSQRPEDAAPGFVHEFAVAFAAWSLGRTRTDADGRATLRVLSMPSVDVGFVGKLGTSTTSAAPLWPGEELAELRLR